MFQSKSIGGFVFRLFLFYGLLLAPWPGLEKGYASVFRAAGNEFFATFGTYGAVRFRLPSKQNVEWDTEINLVNRRNRQGRSFGLVSRHTGYLSTSALIALVLATPVPWTRRWRCLAIGLLLVNAFVILRVTLSILYEFRRVDLFVFSSFWNRVINVAFQTISLSTVATCLVPVIIWILVIFRPSDWEPLLAKSGRTPQQNPSSDGT